MKPRNTHVFPLLDSPAGCAVGRWHRYVGLGIAPFAIFFAVTAGIHFWKPQYEANRYRALLHVRPQFAIAPPGVTPPPLRFPADSQFAAALAAHPGARAISFTPSFAPGRTSETLLGLPDGDTVTVFVDPHLGHVVGQRRESERLMTQVHDLQRGLLAGKAGRILVELGASWLVVWLLTGLYLWWPRRGFSVSGFLWPRGRASGREFGRDLPVVTAVWCSLGALCLLATGTPGTDTSGAWLRTIAATLGEGAPPESKASAHRSELSELASGTPPPRTGLDAEIPPLVSTPAAAPIGDAASLEWCGAVLGEDLKHHPISLERVGLLAAERGVPMPYAIALPVGETGIFSVLSDPHQAFTRTFVHLDQYSGLVLADVRYRDFGRMEKVFLWGAIAHEGRLFGLANQILGTLAALGLLLLASASLASWWRQRGNGDAEWIGARARGSHLPRRVIAGGLVLACLLPLLAASLALLLVIDQLSNRARRLKRADSAFGI